MLQNLWLLIIAALLWAAPASGWGFDAHRQINRYAVYTLPAPLYYYLKPHIRWIEAHAPDPDSRRYAVAEEGARHFIDIEYYGCVDSIPQREEDAIKQYTADSLKSWGHVPWHVQRLYYSLIHAFKSRDHTRILRLLAETGHYLADAHVPLHTTANYNGQFSGQRGIHALLETRSPVLMVRERDFLLGAATYVSDIRQLIWEAVKESHRALDTVFYAEEQAKKRIPESAWYSLEMRKGKLEKQYSEALTLEFNRILGDLVRRRMRQATLAVGKFWFSAWVDAGQPPLDLPEPVQEPQENPLPVPEMGNATLPSRIEPVD